MQRQYELDKTNQCRIYVHFDGLRNSNKFQEAADFHVRHKVYSMHLKMFGKYVNLLKQLKLATTLEWSFEYMIIFESVVCGDVVLDCSILNITIK